MGNILRMAVLGNVNSGLIRDIVLTLENLQADGKTFVDISGNGNTISLVKSSCLYSPSSHVYITYTGIVLDLNNDFEISFGCNIPAASTDPTPVDLFVTTPANKGLRIKPIRSGFQLFVAGTLKTTPYIYTFGALTRDADHTVRIVRSANYLHVYLDGVEAGTALELTQFGDMSNPSDFKFDIFQLKAWNLKVISQGVTLIDSPFAEGTVVTANCPITNLAGVVNGVASAQVAGGTSQYGSYQDSFHFNVLNGFTLYLNPDYNVAIRIPYKNGNPQPVLNPLPTWSSISFYKVADYPAGFGYAETKIKFNANSEGVTDNNNYYFTGENSNELGFLDILPTLNNRIFAEREPSGIKKIIGYSKDKPSALKYTKNNSFEFWILAGQSNGGINSGSKATYGSGLLGFNYKARIWNVANSKFEFLDTYKGTDNNPVDKNYFSISLPLSKLRTDAGKEVLFVHYYVGSTPIYFTGTPNDWNVNTVGGLYSNLLTYLTNAINYLNNRGIPYVFKGMIWNHGESNGDTEEHAISFKPDTKDLIAGVRTHIGFNIPVYLGYISDSPSNHEYRSIVRAAQVALPSEISACTLIDTSTFEYTDGVHLNGNGKKSFANTVNQYAN